MLWIFLTNTLCTTNIINLKVLYPFIHFLSTPSSLSSFYFRWTYFYLRIFSVLKMLEKKILSFAYLFCSANGKMRRRKLSCLLFFPKNFPIYVIFILFRCYLLEDNIFIFSFKENSFNKFMSYNKCWQKQDTRWIFKEFNAIRNFFVHSNNPK